MILQESPSFREGPVRAQRRNGKTLPLAALNFLLGLGSVAGFFSTQSALVSRFGTSHLFYVYLGQGLMTLLLSSLFYLLADRLPRSRFFSGWFIFLGCLVAGSWIALRVSSEQVWVFIGARSLLEAVTLSGSLAYWLIAGDQFSPQEAKRNYSILMGAFILGDMAGGLLIQQTAAIFHGLNFLLLWAGIFMVAPFLFSRRLELPKKRRNGPRPDPGARRGTTPRFARTLTRLSLLLFVFWLAYAFFSDATDFLFNRYAHERLGSEDGLTAYFGKVALGSNAVIFLYHAFFSRAVLRRFGLKPVIVAIPCLIAGIWALAHAHPSLATLALAQGLVYFFIDYWAVTRLHLPLTLIRKTLRGRIKAATEGFGRACGLLVLFGIAGAYSFCPNFEDLSRVILAGSLLFLAFSLLFLRFYCPAPAKGTLHRRRAARSWGEALETWRTAGTHRSPFSSTFFYPARPPP